ncbi:hypothetical protein RQP46_005027 [Phenoliferia psychrophenolica]
MDRIRPSLRDLSLDYDEPAFPEPSTGEEGSSGGVPAATVSRAKPPQILSTSSVPESSTPKPSPATQGAKGKPKSRFALEREQQREREAAQRFSLDLDGNEQPSPPATFLSSLVRDVVEREGGVAAPPSFEQQAERPRGSTGFPSSDELRLSPPPQPPQPAVSTSYSVDPSAQGVELPSLLAAVSQENDSVLAGMSEAEILEEQRNIRESMGLSEGVLKMLEERARKKASPAAAQTQERPRRRPDVAPSKAHPTPTPRPRIPAEDEEEGSPEYIRKHFFPDEPRNANLDWMRAGATAATTTGQASPSFDLTGAPLEAAFDSTGQASTMEHHVSSASAFTLASLKALASSAVPSQRSTALLVLHRILVRESSISVLGGASARDDLRIECALVAGRAIRDANVGVVSQALSLLAFLFSTEPVSAHTRRIRKLEGAEEPPSVLGSFMSSEPYGALAAQLSLASLPSTSLNSILSVLTSILHLSLSPSSPPVTLILETPNLVDALSRRLIAVPWPPPSPASPRPSPAAIAFLTLLSRSSRKAAKHLWERKLVEPALRFLAVLPWELDRDSTFIPLAHELVLESLGLWESMARYGLGTSLRTQGADLIDAVLRGCTGESEREIAQAALQLLTVWTTAAIDPHTTGHDIIWSQVDEWAQVAVTFHRSLLDNGGESGRGLLASAWALLAEWMEGSKVNKSWRGEEERRWLSAKLAVDFEGSGRGATVVRDALRRLAGQAASPAEVDIDSMLVLSALRLSGAYEEATVPPTSPLLHLAQDDISAALSAIVLANPSPPTRSLVVPLLQLLPSDRSRLSHTLDALVTLGAGDEVAARDLTAWVLAFVARNASTDPIVTPALDIASVAQAPQLQHFVTYAIIASSGGRVVAPVFPTTRDLKLAASQRPFASTDAILSSNWPLSVLDELLRSATSPAFEQLPSSWDGSELELVRTALATMRTIQAVPTARATVDAPTLVYDLIKVFMLEKDNLTSATPGAESDLFRDERIQLSMSGLLEPLRIGRRPPQVVRLARRLPAATLEGVSSLVSSAPFYQLYTDLIGLYDATALSHSLFAQILLPPLAMDYPVDFRKLLWIDYAHVLRTIQLEVSDVVTDHTPELGEGALSSFLFPIETDPSLLLAYADALLSGKVTATATPFLFLVAKHHVAATLGGGPQTPMSSSLAAAIAAKGTPALRADLAGWQARVEGDLLDVPRRSS